MSRDHIDRAVAVAVCSAVLFTAPMWATNGNEFPGVVVILVAMFLLIGCLVWAAYEQFE